MAWFSLPTWVARRRASLRTKLLIAFLSIVAILIALGGAGLTALGIASQRAEQIARHQAQIDRIRMVRSLSEQTVRIMGETFLYEYSKPYALADENAQPPFSPIVMNADGVLVDRGAILRELERETNGDPEVVQGLLGSLDDLKSLVDLSLELRTILREGDLRTAHLIYAGEATNLKKQIERRMYTLETQLSQVMQDTAARASRDYASSRLILFLTSGGAVLVALLLGYSFSSSLIRPIRQIETRMRALGSGDFSSQLAIQNRDELGDLGTNVNRASDMLDGMYKDVAAKTSRLEDVSRQLSKYLSPQVYASIFEGRQEAKVTASRKKLTVFFSDIVNFTELTDRLESEELTQLLNHYLSEMSQIALEHGATIDKYVGDAIIAFFGDPETNGVREDARSCVRMAIAMRDRLQELQDIWRDAGIAQPLRCRMGIHTDYCTVGNFGSVERLDYTIVGRGVNIASRLENTAEAGDILMSFETYAHVQEVISCTEAGEVEVKGLAYPIATFRVDGRKDG